MNPAAVKQKISPENTEWIYWVQGLTLNCTITRGCPTIRVAFLFLTKILFSDSYSKKGYKFWANNINFCSPLALADA